MLSNFCKSGNLARLTYFDVPASVSFSHTLIDLSLEDEMKTFVLFVSKAFISSILPMWATKDLQKEAQCKILGIYKQNRNWSPISFGKYINSGTRLSLEA